MEVIEAACHGGSNGALRGIARLRRGAGQHGQGLADGIGEAWAAQIVQREERRHHRARQTGRCHGHPVQRVRRTEPGPVVLRGKGLGVRLNQ